MNKVHKAWLTLSPPRAVSSRTSALDSKNGQQKTENGYSFLLSVFR